MMTDSSGTYRNALHCAATTLKNEGESSRRPLLLSPLHSSERDADPKREPPRLAGPLAFYKGFSMCFWRLWPHSIVSLLVFEQLRALVGMKPL